MRSVVAYSGAHPAHQKMLAECCATSIKMLGEWSVDKPPSNLKKIWSYLATAWQLRSYPADVIVIEGTTPTIIMAPLINGFSRFPKTIISLSGEDAFYQTFVVGGKFRQATTRWGFTFVSGIIAIGDLVAGLAKKHLRPLPIETRYPSVPESRLDLLTLAPSLDSHNLLLIGGRSTHYKGVDIAIKCLETLRASFPDAQLTILGFPDIKERPGVNVPGPVADIRPYLSSSSALIHPGRGEAFGLVVVEAMLAGVVPFVSEWTGAATLVNTVAPELVVPLQVEAFTKRISNFWSAPLECRQQLSYKCRHTAKEFIAQAAAQPSLKSFIESFGSD